MSKYNEIKGEHLNYMTVQELRNALAKADPDARIVLSSINEDVSWDRLTFRYSVNFANDEPEAIFEIIY